MGDVAQMECTAEANSDHGTHESRNRLDLNTEQDCSSPQDAGCISNEQLLIQVTEEEEQLIRSLDVGTEFESDEHAHQFYVKYAKLVGFRVRKDWISRSKVHGQVLTRKFSCSNQGKRKKNKRELKRIRKETRTGCLAYMLIQRQSNGKYRVVQFEPKHNHEYVGPVFRRNKKPRVAQAVETEIGHCSDHLDSQPISDSLDSQAGTDNVIIHPAMDLEDIDFNEFDECIKVHLSSGRTREMEAGDAGRLLLYFQRQQFENPSFTYRIQLDSDDKITNIFWTDEIMTLNYDHFGDVVCFDSLHRTSFDYRPFVQFVGLNHHRQPVIFGAALLYDESVESITWLFHSFVEAMGGKKPKEFVTDQDAVIIEAANLALHETKVHVCILQMVESALNNLRHMVHAAPESFASDFRRCAFKCRDEEEDFVSAWDSMANKYGLGNNEWLRWLLREREKWSPVYGCNTFFVDLDGKHLVEGLSMGLKDYLKPEVDILDFMKHFRKIIREQCFKEQEYSREMEKYLPKLLGNIFYLKHASEIYTSKAFEMFQHEYEKSLDVVVKLVSEKESLFEYKANTFGQAQEYTVFFNSSDDKVCCSCMMFQRVGMLCSHSMKVLDFNNIKVVPSSYILKRWSKDARTGKPKERLENMDGKNPREVAAKRYYDLRRSITKLSAQAALSEEAYKFAETKFSELFKGMEKILNPDKPNAVQLMSPSSNAANSSEEENQNVSVGAVQLRNQCAHDNDQLKRMEEEIDHDHDDINTDAAMNLCPERSFDPAKDFEQVRFPESRPPISCSIGTDEVASNNEPHSIPPSEHLFGYEVGVAPMYQSTNLLMTQHNAHINICSSPNSLQISSAQMLQEPYLQAAIMIDGQAREGINIDISHQHPHPHPSSFIHYDQRYIASADGRYLGMR